jgi:hypothetical protein
MTSAVAGDVVRFLSGDYEPPATVRWEQPAWNPSNSGTAANPITFMSDALHGAVIHDAADAAANGNAAIGAFQRHYIIWDGFKVIKDKSTGVYADSIIIITEGNYNIIRNIDGTGRPHRYHTNGSIISVHAGTGNRIYNNILRGMTADPTPVEAVVNASAIYIFQTNETYIYNNTVYDSNNCISWKTGPNRIHIYNNHVYNCTRTAFFPTIEVAGTTDMFVHHNLVRNSRQFVDNEDSPAANFFNLRVYNNTIYHSGAMRTGMYYGLNGGNQPGRNTQIYNNLFHLGGNSRILELYDNVSAAAFPITLDNNLYYNSAGTPSWIRNSTTNTTLAAWRTTTGRELASLTSNPQFLNGSGAFSTVTDFRLAAASPARGAGLGGAHIGAFTDDAMIIGYATPSGQQVDLAPAAPRNFATR